MSRRHADLKAAARERKIPMGVYALRNLATGGVRLGSSVNAPAAMNRHHFMLRMGSHPDKVLQAEWHRDGADSFVFEMLDLLSAKDEPGFDPADDLIALRALWTVQLGDKVVGQLA
jgi:hypothetical protein